MTIPPSSPQARLLLETTLFQEETSLAALQDLLDQVEDQAPAWSAQKGWRRFRADHAALFPAPPLRRAALWTAALAAVGGGVPLLLPDDPAPAAPAAVTEPVQDPRRLVSLYQLISLNGPTLRAPLPPSAQWSQEPAALPNDAILDQDPFFLPSQEDALPGQVVPLPVPPSQEDQDAMPEQDSSSGVTIVPIPSQDGDGTP